MTTEHALSFEGGCTCGSVRYRMASGPMVVHCCHCRWCQRETGASFALNALIEAERVHVLKGEVQVITTPTNSGKGQNVSRCPSCHVALWSAYAGLGDALRFIRVGTLDEPDRFPPDIHIYTSSKQPWVVLPPGAQAVPEYYKAAEHWPPASLERRAALVAAIAAKKETGASLALAAPTGVNDLQRRPRLLVQGVDVLRHEQDVAAPPDLPALERGNGAVSRVRLRVGQFVKGVDYGRAPSVARTARGGKVVKVQPRPNTAPMSCGETKAHRPRPGLLTSSSSTPGHPIEPARCAYPPAMIPASSSPPPSLDRRILRLEAARHVLGPLPDDELREVAEEALMRGTRSRSLSLLACAPHCDNHASLRALFEAGLREVGIALPRPLDAAERLKRHYASQVAAGRISALEGARAIVVVYGQVGNALPHDRAHNGDEFGIATLYGLYSALDGLPAGDRACAALEAKLVEACGAIASGRRG